MLKTRITQAFHNSDTIDKSILIKDLQEVLTGLNNGFYRIAEKKHGQWITHSWLKESILLALRFFTMNFSEQPIGYDKIPHKFYSWNEKKFQQARFRMVPGAIVRFGAFIAQKVILMPSFINIGAYVDEGSMIDTWATVGSCAQIGKNVHISGGVGIGGVLEPIQNNPVIIEDNCFIGARSEIAEGIIVEEGAVISMGVFLSASTKIIHRNTGNITYGKIPAYSVVVPGTLPGKDPRLPQTSCAIIVKTVDEKTRQKTSINELLRF